MTVTEVATVPIRVEGLDAVLLRAPGGAEALVALRGATLLRWRAPVGGRLLDLVDGYRDAAELDGQDGVRNGVMVPFVNRIADGRYHFDGREHDLLPGVPEGPRTVYHGFLRRLPTTVVRAGAAGESAAQVLLSARIRPDTAAGYPFDLDVEIRYRLTPTTLALRITAHNAGTAAVPYAAGWHPYFTLGDTPVDELELSVPATTVIRTRDLIPLDGPAAFDPVTARPDLDFRLPRPIGGHRLDVAFADLAADPDGWATTLLRDPATGIQLRVRQLRGLLHVFTGDTLSRDRRRSIALEPVEVMTDAFNRRDCRTRITLPAGQARTFRCLVEVR